jgi:glycosyltransferase involved in cell wall biosynthesis
MRLAHFVLSGAVVGGVERYLAELLAASDPTLEHRVVTDHAGSCDFSGRWPVTSLAWSAEGDGPRAGEGEATGVLAGLGGVCLFHYPPSGETLAAARRARMGVAIFCHDHRWWCASASRYYGRTRSICGIRGATGACALRYYALRCGGLRPGPMVRGLSRAAAGRRALAAADAVFTASSFMAAEAALHGASPARTQLAPLPTHLESAAPAPPQAGEPPVILCASRLTPEKGVGLLLDAFALMHVRARLELAGSGIGARATEHAVATHPARERIRLLGHLEDAAMRAAYARASAVAVPSLWPEPFGLVGIEALAAGRPVVTTGVGGIADWARTDLGVITAPPHAPAELAAALDRTLSDPSWAARAREAGSRWVRERHSIAAHVARLRDVLRPLSPRDGAA